MTYSSAKREENRAQSRRLILEAACSLFEAAGYETITIRDIAKVSGYSTGAIFAHWISKEQLFAESMGRAPVSEAQGAELLAELKALAPARADELQVRWAA